MIAEVSLSAVVILVGIVAVVIIGVIEIFCWEKAEKEDKDVRQ